jgi:Zn-dependent protease
MFTKRYPLFKLLGFEVKIDLTWLILAILVTASLAQGLFPILYEGLTVETYWLMGIAGTLGLFFSIVFHELAHSLVARQFGFPIKGITLFIFGGVAEMDEEPPSAKSEFYMAIVGPIASFVLAFAFYGLYTFTTAFNGPTPVAGTAFYLSYLNGLLAVFNLVPAFPLDGGRVLRAALWGWKKNFRRATRIASNIGSGFGIALMMLGALAFLGGNFIGGMWWILIGLFLRNAAGMSYQQMMMREALHGEPVRRFMNASPVTVTPDISLQELVEDYIYKYHYKMFPVVEGSRPVGCISVKEVQGVPKDEWSQRQVKDVMEPCSKENTIDPNTDAMKAWSIMNQSGKNRLLVVEKGQLVGIIALRDLMKFISLKLDLEQTV